MAQGNRQPQGCGRRLPHKRHPATHSNLSLLRLTWLSHRGGWEEGGSGRPEKATPCHRYSEHHTEPRLQGDFLCPYSKVGSLFKQHDPGCSSFTPAAWAYLITDFRIHSQEKVLVAQQMARRRRTGARNAGLPPVPLCTFRASVEEIVGTFEPVVVCTCLCLIMLELTPLWQYELTCVCVPAPECVCVCVSTWACLTCVFVSACACVSVCACISVWVAESLMTACVCICVCGVWVPARVTDSGRMNTWQRHPPAHTEIRIDVFTWLD